MTRAIAGRAVALVGVALGIAAIWIDTISSSGYHFKLSSDGTVTSYLLITLIAAALLLLAGFAGQRGLDDAAAVAGAAALGLFLFLPTGLALYHLGYVGTGGWLGICTVLVPAGAWFAHVSDRSEAPKRTRPPLLMTIPVAAGLALCLAGIWFTAEHDPNVSYWNLGVSGHPIGILTLALVILGALLVLAAATGVVPWAVDGALLVAGVTFGFVESELIGNAFGDLGSAASGVWIEAAGGVLLLAGAWWLRKCALGEVKVVKPARAAKKSK